MVFHLNCGKNVCLSNNRQVAERTGDGFDHGVTFSSRPLHVKNSEIFQLRIEAKEDKWAGSLRFGVTTYCPDGLEMGKLRALTDFIGNKENPEKFWIWSGHTIHHYQKETKINLSLHSLSVNDVVGLQVRPNGELHFYHDSERLLKIQTGVPADQDLYVVFDVYGSTKRVSYAVKGGKLKELCRKKILEIVEFEQIDNLLLPKTLKSFLKENYHLMRVTGKRKRDEEDETGPDKKRLR